MTSHPPEDDKPHAKRMHEVFDFESRPGLAMIRPEVAERISEGMRKQRAKELAENAKAQQLLPMKPRDPSKKHQLLEGIVTYGVRPGVAAVRMDVAKALAKAATPPESDWTDEDEANQRRVNAEINKALERMYIRMVVAIGAVAALLAAAIHFLGKQ